MYENEYCSCPLRSLDRFVESVTDKLIEKLKQELLKEEKIKTTLQEQAALRLVNARELCNYLGISKPTLYNWKKEEHLSRLVERFTYKKDKRTLYDAAAIENQIQQQRCLFKKEVKVFCYYDFILEDAGLVKKWEARIAVKNKIGQPLTTEERKFVENLERGNLLSSELNAGDTLSK